MILKRTMLACLAALGAGPALGQGFSGPWAFSATGYLWLPAVKTTVGTDDFGTIDSTLSASDAISDLEFGFMGDLQARRGRWSLIGDIIYTDISTSSSTPKGLLFDKGTLDTKLTVFTGYAAYRVAETPEVAFDLGAGFRLFSVDVDGKLEGNLAATETFGGSETWAVPLVAARAVFPIADRWTATLVADFGGVSSDETTWQAMATIDYAFAENWSGVLAYRYMDVEKSVDGNDTSIELYGPVLGITYRF
jgi:opacity protein-like surface antigen